MTFALQLRSKIGVGKDMYDSRAIANTILECADSLGIPITNLALQKIAYFCHGWFLASHGKPLCRQSFEAWQFGPVLQGVYREFKSFERAPISVRCTSLDPLSGLRHIVPSVANPEAHEIVKECVYFYGRLSAGTLVEMSHDPDGPWDRLWNSGGDINPGMKIDNENIREYFCGMTRPF